MPRGMSGNTHSLFDFGRIAREYDRWYDTPRGKEYDQQEKSAVLQCLPRPLPGDRLLEVGCGTGHWSRFFAAQGYKVTGVDLAPEMIARARSYPCPGCRYEVSDACHLLFQDKSFEVAAAITSLEFIADVKAAVAEIFRCVKPRGRVIIGTLNKLDPLNRQRLDRKEEPYYSGRMFSANELDELLQPYGTVRIYNTGRNLESRGDKSGGAFIVAEVRP